MGRDYLPLFLLMISRSDIEPVYAALTLASRRPAWRGKWIRRGFGKMRPMLVAYWERRLSKGNPADLAIFETTRRGYLEAKSAPKPIRQGILGSVPQTPSIVTESKTATAFLARVSKTGAAQSGVGTELKKLLHRIGIHSTPTCSCNARAQEMNWRGIEWCEQNILTIVSWLEEEAKNRGLPFARIAGETILKMAIRRAKKAAKTQGISAIRTTSNL